MAATGQSSPQANPPATERRPVSRQTSRLERELAEALRTGPFAVALRAALTARGLALSRVQHRLAQRGIRVGVTSLS